MAHRAGRPLFCACAQVRETAYQNEPGSCRTGRQDERRSGNTPGPGNPQGRAPYPYIRPSSYDWSWGKSDYDALQFLFDKKYSNGLATMVSYTYSKSIDIGCSGFVGEGCNVQDLII